MHHHHQFCSFLSLFFFHLSFFSFILCSYSFYSLFSPTFFFKLGEEHSNLVPFYSSSCFSPLLPSTFSFAFLFKTMQSVYWSYHFYPSISSSSSCLSFSTSSSFSSSYFVFFSVLTMEGNSLIDFSVYQVLISLLLFSVLWSFSLCLFLFIKWAVISYHSSPMFR